MSYEVRLMNLPHTKDQMLLCASRVTATHDALLGFRTLGYCTCHYPDDGYENYKHEEVKGNQCRFEGPQFLLKGRAIFRI